MFQARSKAKADREARELLAAYKHNRRTSRKNERIKSKRLYALAFSFVGRKMLSLHEWKECYCVCRAWKHMLSDDTKWKRRIVYLEPVKCVKRQESSRGRSFRDDTRPSPKKFWHPLSYRQLACSKLSLMVKDFEPITWKWDCTIVSIHSLELFSHLYNRRANLKCRYSRKKSTLSLQFDQYSPTVLKVDLARGRFSLPILRERAPLLIDAKQFRDAMSILSSFKFEDAAGQVLYRLLPLIKYHGLQKLVNALDTIFQNVPNLIGAEKGVMFGPEDQSEVTGPLNRQSFAMMLLSVCQKYLLANGERTELVWGGNHPDISDSMSRHSWDFASIGSIAQSYAQTREVWAPELSSLYEIALKYKTPFSRRNFMSGVWGLCNDLGYVFMAINMYNGKLYFQESPSGPQHHQINGGTKLWNEYVQMQSQNLRNGLGRRTEELFYKITVRCVLPAIDRESQVWPTPINIVRTRFHHANILAWAHGRVASWERDGPNPAKEAAVAIFFREKTEYTAGDLGANDSDEDTTLTKEDSAPETGKTSTEEAADKSLWVKVSSPEVRDLGQKEAQVRKEEYSIGYSSTWN